MGHPSRSLDDSSSAKIWTMEVLLRKFQRRKVLATELENILITSSKTVTFLYPYPTNQPKAKLQSFRLILLAEMISRQTNTVKPLIQFYNEKEQVGHNKMKMNSVRRKKSTRKLNAEVKTCAKRENQRHDPE